LVRAFSWSGDEKAVAALAAARKAHFETSEVWRLRVRDVHFIFNEREQHWRVP
jgi:hypothetical protein